MVAGRKTFRKGAGKDAVAAIEAVVEAAKPKTPKKRQYATDQARLFGYKRNKYALDCVKATSLLVRGNPLYAMRNAIVHGLVQTPRVKKGKGEYTPLKLIRTKRGRLVSEARQLRTRSRRSEVLSESGNRFLGAFGSPHGLFAALPGSSPSNSKDMISKQYQPKVKAAIDAAAAAAVAQARVEAVAEELHAAAKPGSAARRQATKAKKEANEKKKAAVRVVVKAAASKAPKPKKAASRKPKGKKAPSRKPASRKPATRKPATRAGSRKGKK